MRMSTLPISFAIRAGRNVLAARAPMGRACGRAAVAAGLALMLAATAGRAQTKTQVVFVAPNQVEAGKAFDVSLSGKTSQCHALFSHAKVTVGEGSLLLTVVAENDPVAKCVAGDQDYQTDFRIPGLKAGTYEVNASLQPACSLSPTPCPFAAIIQYGGTLLARDSADLGFGFRPKTAAADKPFNLFLFSHDYTCANEYTKLASEVRGHTLLLSFTNRVLADVLCMADLGDDGPSFPVAAMRAGVYQVFTSVSPYCPPGHLCPLILKPPQLSGALTVGDGVVSLRSQESGGNLSRAGSGAEIGNTGNKRAAFRKGTLRLDGRQRVFTHGPGNASRAAVIPAVIPSVLAPKNAE